MAKTDDSWQAHFNDKTDEAIQRILDARIANTETVGRGAAKLYLEDAVEILKGLIARFN